MLGILCSAVVGAQNGNLMVFPANKEVEQRYTILNSSNDVMRLGKIRTSCTCADVKYLKAELPPGESTELIVTLKTNTLSGSFTHTVYVETDHPQQRFMRFVIKGNAIPLLKVSPEPVRYIGTLTPGEKYEYHYELVPSDPQEKVSLDLIPPELPLPGGAEVKLERQDNKYLLTAVILPRPDQRAVSINFSVKIKEPKNWADIKFSLNGRIQNSRSSPPAPGKRTP